jgi:SAM-dependent methyltransferase
MEHISTCNLCGSSQSIPLYGRGWPHRKRVWNRICTNCGLVFQSPRLTEEENRRMYEKWVENYQGVGPEAYRDYTLKWGRMYHAFLKDYIRPGMKVLDIGCSTGAFLSILKSLGVDCSGLNPEESFAAFARGEYGLDVETCLFEDYPERPAFYDVITGHCVFEHFRDPMAMLKRIHRMLKEGGYLQLLVPNVWTPNGLLWENFFLEHIITPSPGTMRHYLHKVGFEVVKEDFNGHITEEGNHARYEKLIAVKGRPKVAALEKDSYKEVRKFLFTYHLKTLLAGGYRYYIYHALHLPEGGPVSRLVSQPAATAYNRMILPIKFRHRDYTKAPREGDPIYGPIPMLKTV